MNKRILLLLFLLSISSPNPILAQKELKENEKLFATAKVWGFLKYYHPNVAEGKFDWDNQLFEILGRIEHASTTEELSKIYLEWVNSLGDLKECRKCKKKTNKEYFNKNFDLSWIDNEELFTSALSKYLRHTEANRSHKYHEYLKVAGKAGNVEFDDEKAYNKFKWTDNHYRLLSLFRYWNFVEYFYPYKYLTDEVWDDVLMEMIPKFLSPRSELDYHLAMLELVVKLDDSHAGLNTNVLNDFFGLKYIPIIHRIVDGKAVVTGFFNDSLAKLNDLEIGDVITKVNGKKIDVVLTNKAAYIQGSNRTAKTAYAWNKIFNGSTDSVELEILREDKLLNKKIGRYLFNEFQYKRPIKNTWEMMLHNIGYVNMATLMIDDIPEMIDSLINTKAIIFDIRNYPKDFIFGSMDFLFSSRKKMFFKSIVPDLTYPGKFVWKKGDVFKVSSKPKYKGKVVILVNQRTISLAEFTAMYLQSAENSITIGSQTLAADGNVSRLEFVGGFKTGISGIGIFYPDGSETQRKGIKIDIEIKPTISGIQQGRDEVLEKAIGVLNE